MLAKTLKSKLRGAPSQAEGGRKGFGDSPEGGIAPKIFCGRGSPRHLSFISGNLSLFVFVPRIFVTRCI